MPAMHAGSWCPAAAQHTLWGAHWRYSRAHTAPRIHSIKVISSTNGSSSKAGIPGQSTCRLKLVRVWHAQPEGSAPLPASMTLIAAHSCTGGGLRWQVGFAGYPPARTQQGLPITSLPLVCCSDFAGFQYQTPKIRTVQGELEKGLARVTLPVGRVVGASRTDGGAHALGQVAHVDVSGSPDSIQPDSLMMYLNGVLPGDVKVRHIDVAPEGFDSHRCSVGKEYIYKLSGGVPDPMQAKQRWWLFERWCEQSRGKPQHPRDLLLDVGAMQKAADLLLGTHNFSAFMDKKRPAGLGALKRKRPHLVAKGIKPVRTPEKNIRTLWMAQVTQEAGPGDVTLEVAGNGFLYRMVRLLAAGLAEVGQGRLTPQQLQQLLAGGDRSKLPEAAPAHGLYLKQVLFELPAGVEAAVVPEAAANGEEE